MVTALLTILVVLGLVVAGIILIVGRGSWRMGVVRVVRRLRTTRRRILEPGLSRLSRVIRGAWNRPGRRRIVDQLLRLTDRVERMAAESTELIRARGDLSRAVSRIHDVAVVNPVPGGTERGKIRKQGGRRGWLVAGLLAVTGLAFTAANVWFLTNYILPHVPEDLLLERTMTIPVAVSSLAFLLGLAYFALGSFEGLGGRVFRWAAWLLIAALAAVEGMAVVTALEGSGLATPTWWGGTAVAVFLGLAGALIPAIIAATAHAAIERLEQWLSARDVREARSALTEQSLTAERLRQTLDGMEARVTAVRAELTAMSNEGAGKLLMGGDAATVERATVVLRRLARTVETDPDTPGADGSSAIGTGLVLVRDVAAVAIWLLTAAAVLDITLPAAVALQRGTSLLSVAVVAGVGVLLIMGAILRWIILEVPIERATSMRGALVLLTGLAAAAVGVALAPRVAETGVLEATPGQAGAWLILLILVAAAASAGLVNGVRALGALVTAILAGLAWLVLALVSVALAALDILLTGNRYGGRPRRGRRNAQRRSARLGSSGPGR